MLKDKLQVGVGDTECERKLVKRETVRINSWWEEERDTHRDGDYEEEEKERDNKEKLFLRRKRKKE